MGTVTKLNVSKLPDTKMPDKVNQAHSKPKPPPLDTPRDPRNGMPNGTTAGNFKQSDTNKSSMPKPIVGHSED